VARLFVIPARDAAVAVILRRGPARWYHVIKWETDRDVFTQGAWIKARIYENKCDVSPDGRLLLYFVHQGSRAGTEFTDSWTAISRVPWLNALAVWPQGTTYGGGGRFVDNRRVALRGVGHEPLRLYSDYSLRGIEIVNESAELHQASGEIADVDWCGKDHKGATIYSLGGQLFRRGRKSDQLLADFTDVKPDPQPAPDWATRPL
jgi:hypothetical protein